MKSKQDPEPNEIRQVFKTQNNTKSSDRHNYRWVEKAINAHSQHTVYEAVCVVVLSMTDRGKGPSVSLVILKACLVPFSLIIIIMEIITVKQKR